MAPYKKPDILSQGRAAEPVEAGCCIRTCGGSPRPLLAKKTNRAEAAIKAATK